MRSSKVGMLSAGVSLWRGRWRTALGQSGSSIWRVVPQPDTAAGVEWTGLCQVVTRHSGWLSG